MQVNGPALRALRITAGLTLAVLGERAGIHHSHISLIENGKRQGTPAVHKRLADALGVPMTEWVDFEVADGGSAA